MQWAMGIGNKLGFSPKTWELKLQKPAKCDLFKLQNVAGRPTTNMDSTMIQHILSSRR
jgi:hypothetical protein